MVDRTPSPHFEDHFSKHANTYARHRPQYPRALYEYLASIAPSHSLAWDCGTGNGQAALGLADYFEHVVATDASAEQIARAYPHPKVEYRVEPAERVSLSNSSVDLITVAVAIHWFSFDEFYREVKRVLKPVGVLAAWTYNWIEVSPEVDVWIEKYSGEILNGYWPERIRLLEGGYKSIPFPFDEMTPPSLWIEAQWNLDQLAGFLDSWSATQRYKQQHGNHPLEQVWEKITAAWGAESKTRTVRWPLHFRVGRNKPE